MSHLNSSTVGCINLEPCRLKVTLVLAAISAQLFVAELHFLGFALAAMFGWSASPPVSLATRPKAPGRAKASAGSSTAASRVARAVAQAVGPADSVGQERSRSPVRVPLPGLRGDAPGRLERRFASLPLRFVTCCSLSITWLIRPRHLGSKHASVE